ncbi:hypothetical protein [Spirosoma sp.]|uniref:hypothetical protein n=1 Tax=Spirosoma sp. TaxID=1899569 RepID=UPI002609F951|nr:hypothetical protein [Spirosoma sp.]MCX6217616.1 hypothetical protein [Spirosoma sp.]
MAKLKRFKFSFNVPIYNNCVLVFHGYTHAELIYDLHDLNGSEEFIRMAMEAKASNGFAMLDDQNRVVIWTSTLPLGASEMALAEHERRHATDLILNSKGIPHPKHETSEAHAYLQDWIAERMWDELAKYVAKN